MIIIITIAITLAYPSHLLGAPRGDLRMEGLADIRKLLSNTNAIINSATTINMSVTMLLILILILVLVMSILLIMINTTNIVINVANIISITKYWY